MLVVGVMVVQCVTLHLNTMVFGLILNLDYTVSVYVSVSSGSSALWHFPKACLATTQIPLVWMDVQVHRIVCVSTVTLSKVTLIYISLVSGTSEADHCSFITKEHLIMTGTHLVQKIYFYPYLYKQYNCTHFHINTFTVDRATNEQW